MTHALDILAFVWLALGCVLCAASGLFLLVMALIARRPLVAVGLVAEEPAVASPVLARPCPAWLVMLRGERSFS